MKQILVIGAGRSAVILIDYLLNESSKCGWIVTIASKYLTKQLANEEYLQLLQHF